MDELVSKLSYCSIVGTPNPNDGITHALDTLDNCDVEKAVLEACRETAFSFRSSVADRSNRTMLIGLLRAKEDKPLLVDRVKQVLNADPRLGVCRFDLAGTGVPDGFTPLHVLASNGNIYLLKIFLEIGVQKSGINGKSVISPWTVDLQGRTPLHVAVTNGHVEIASVLRQAMKTENRGTPEAPVYIDPVGENAPIDLTGNTPLGWASKESKGKHLKEFMPFESQSVVSMADVVSACPDASKSCRDLIAELHVTPVKIGEKTPTSTPSCAGIGVAESGSSLLRKGDKSILPQSPLVLRSGTSPLVQRSQASNSPMIRRERVISASTNILEDVLGTVAPEIADLPHGSQLWYGFSEATGWRPYMEDRIFVNVPILSVLTCLRLPPSIVHDRAKNIDFETPTKGAAHLPLPVPISSTIKHSIITDIEKLKRVNPCTVFGCNSTYQLLSESYLFGVCDGHGGDYAVNFLQKHIPATITNNYIEMYKLLVTLRCASTSPIVEEEISGLFCEMFKTACLSLDEKLSEQGRMLPQAGNKGPLYLDKSGSTGLFCLVNGEYISVGNVGDTRAVCGSSNERGGVEAVALSHDHKPNEAGERERIEAAGAGVKCVAPDNFKVYIPDASGGSENSITLGMSRSFGDFPFKQNNELSPEKQAVCPVPSVLTRRILKEDMFIVLASDGIWDVMSNQAVVDFVYNKLIMANKGCKEHAAGSKNDEKNQICGGNLTPMSKSQLYSPVLLPQIADDLLHHCIEELHSQDNVSVVIILLKDPILF